MDTPYKGLQPYTELDKDNFYGRVTEKRILMDKILIHKLTFLFAASGVGKSSLLRAAVLPALTESPNSYDVVYYNDWVEQPLLNLKSHIAEILRDNGRVTPDFEFDLSLPLKPFLRICSVFTSAPFILILDQFEEFFNYQKYHQDNFRQFVEEIAQAVHDNATDTTFVIAMREDFALELNAFKEVMPTFLIDNFYRLERLSLANARMAIEQPLKKQGFHYEAGLLDALVQDLSEREKVEREGSQSQEWVMAELVEPPHLQIVCQQLWELDRGRADKEIKRATYQRKGLAVGLLENYFKDKIETFSYPQKKVASDAFNHLVNKHGTKIAHPLPDLAKLLNVSSYDLGEVLDKLEAARVLRRQKRKETLWYELYHDMFSHSIYRWNEQFKFRHRMYRIGQGVAAFALVGAVVFGIYDYWDNSTHYHVKVNFAEGVNAPVQVWQGRHDGFDMWGQHKFLHELSYSRVDIEPDKLFDVQGVWDIEHVHQEMIEELPLVERVQAYYDAGYLDKAVHDMVSCAIYEHNLDRSKQFVDILKFFNTREGIDLLIKYLTAANSNRVVSSKIRDSLGTIPYIPLFLNKELLHHPNLSIRLLAIDYFAALGGRVSEKFLIDLLADENMMIRRKAIKKLSALKVQIAEAYLLEALENELLKSTVIEAIGNLNYQAFTSRLYSFLSSSDYSLKQKAIWALVKLGDKSITPYLISLLENKENNFDWQLKNKATEKIKILGNKDILPIIIPLLDNVDPDERCNMLSIVRHFGSEKILPDIIPLLHDSNEWGLSCVVDTIKTLGNKQTVSLITPFLSSVNKAVRRDAINIIGSLGSKQTLPLIVPLLDDPKWQVRSSAIEEIGKMDNQHVLPLITPFLNDPFSQVRVVTTNAIVKILDGKSALSLISPLLEDSSFEVKSNTVRAIGSLRYKQAFSHIIPLLTNPDWNVRLSVVDTVNFLGDKRVLPILNPLFEDYVFKDSSPSAYSNVIDIIGTLGYKQSYYLTIPLISDSNSQIRSSAVKAMETLGDKQILADIISLLNDPSSDVRSTAVKTIEVLGDKQALPSIIPLLNDPNLSVRSNAVRAIGVLGNSQDLYLISPLLSDSDWQTQKDAINVIGILGYKGNTQAFPHLTPLLNDFSSDWNVRSSSIEALEALNNEQILPLIASLANNSFDLEIQDSATRALYNLLLSQKELNEIFYEKIQFYFEIRDIEHKSISDIISLIEDITEFNSISLKRKFELFSTLSKQYIDNNRIQKAIAENLVNLLKIKNNKKVFYLIFKQFILNEEVDFWSRLKLFSNLDKINHQEISDFIFEILEKPNFDNDMQSFKFASFNALATKRNDRAKTYLIQELDKLTQEKQQWRKTLKKHKTDKNKCGQQQTDSEWKYTYWESRIAYSLTQNNPQYALNNLLNHPLANVRQGAWQGLAFMMEQQDTALSGGELFEKIYDLHHKTDQAYIRHATYRAIDLSLTSLEAVGTQKDLDKLEEIFAKHQKREQQTPQYKAILQRIEWSKAMLDHRLNQLNIDELRERFKDELAEAESQIY
ncbi:HEAT repeat domain-containing protein [Candidatus Albibeggiatoa sp. nov. NOAA]|uniref:HEAT repeat domain-containing protein n=1 Tax=Candidatus Albibeggiatoa sp. nov. NOAA TaxID=3162724 RepID=UPI0032F5A31C|nr:HEAT repeat domain-containing protein [Thiotrichaceae bacterium]